MPRLSFTEHPAAVGETYLEHLGTAWSFSGSMIRGGLACFIHGLFPFLCTSTGSAAIRRLHERMVVNRVRMPAVAAPEPAARQS
jgi:Family of unknown function (DUF6356)